MDRSGRSTRRARKTLIPKSSSCDMQVCSERQDVERGGPAAKEEVGRLQQTGASNMYAGHDVTTTTTSITLYLRIGGS